MRPRDRRALIVLALVMGFAGFWHLTVLRPPNYHASNLALLFRDLEHGDRATRDLAEDALRRMGTNALPALLEMLNARDSVLKLWVNRHTPLQFSSSERVYHQRAVKGLEILGPAAVPAIPDLIRAAEASRRRFDIWPVLVRSGEQGMPLLISALTNQNARVRCELVYSLGGMGGVAGPAVPALVRLLDDPDTHARCAAAYALGSIRQQPEIVVPALEAALASPDPQMRQTSAKALGAFGDDARSAASSLSKLGNEADGTMRQTSAQALIQIGAKREASSIVLSLLQIRDTDLRVWAVRHISDAGMPPEDAVSALAALKSDAEPATRRALIDTLSDLAPKATEPASKILPELLQDSDLEMRKAAAHVIALLPATNPAVARVISLALQDSDRRVRKALVEKFAQNGPATIPFVLRAMEDQDSGVREQAVRTLGTFGSQARSALEAVRKRLDDPDRAVRLAALGAVAGIEPSAYRGQTYFFGAQAQEETRAIESAKNGIFLSMTERQSPEWPKAALQSGDFRLRREAISRLAEQGPEALPQLLSATRDFDPGVGGAAFGVLLRSHSKNPEAQNAIIDAAKQSTSFVSQNLRMALVFADSNALPGVKLLLEHRDSLRYEVQLDLMRFTNTAPRTNHLPWSVQPHRRPFWQGPHDPIAMRKVMEEKRKEFEARSKARP